MAWKIVIAGGGFGGFYAARTLERILPRQSARVTIVSEDNFMLYTPLLPGAAAGTLEPRHVVVPLRESLRRTDVQLGTVTGAELDRRVVRIRRSDGSDDELPYDQLIVALGSVARVLPIPGLAEHAIGFKNLPEAIALRNGVLRTLEVAESTEDPAQRRAWLTYVFVGAGYAGLEGLAELQDFAADVVQLYPRCRTEGMRWLLVEARDRVMPEIKPSLAEFATRELRSRGIEIRTGTTLDALNEHEVRLSGGEVIPTRTVVWTAGVRPTPGLEAMGLPLADNGRVRVDACLRVEGHPNVWAIGDGANVDDPARPGNPCPPTAQHAIRQGRLAARNVAATIGRGEVRRFSYKTRGVFVDMGHRDAVASTMGIRWRGLPAWFLARTYHLLMMPGLKRKTRLLVDWNLQIVFGRDASELGRLGHPPSLADSAVAAAPGQPVASDRDPDIAYRAE